MKYFALLIFVAILFNLGCGEYHNELTTVISQETEDQIHVKDTDAIKCVISKHSPRARTESGQTFLHLAIQRELTEVIPYLMKSKPVELAVDNRGLPPLHYCAIGYHLQSLEQMLCNDCDPDIQDKHGDTILHRLSIMEYKYKDRKDLKMVEMVLKHSGNPNVKNIFGFTPLHYAALSRNQEILQLLLTYGADPQSEDIMGRKPIDVITLGISDEEVAAMRRDYNYFISTEEISRNNDKLIISILTKASRPN